jgi:ferric-dicitrate binding protein FerR (iron transport regulator)
MAKRILASVAVLAVLPSLSLAQAPGRISVSYESAPVSDVVSSFARFSHRTIVVAPDVRSRVISGRVENDEWMPALDQLLGEQGLVVRPDSGGVLRVEEEQPLTVDFQDAPLSRVLASIAGFAKHSITVAPEVGDRVVSFTARSVDWQRALDALLHEKGLTAFPGANGDLLVVRP